MQVTIGIATWNRADLLRQTLESLTTLHVGPQINYRLCICDNNSTDRTPQVVESFANRLPLDYLEEPTQGKSFALNRLLQQARDDGASWLVLTDDDVLVEPDWLEAYGRAIEQYPAACCLGGPILPWLPRPVSGRKKFLLEHYPFLFALLDVEKDAQMLPPHVTAFGANMAVRCDAVPNEGFNTRLGPSRSGRVSGEEVDLIERMIAGGGLGREGWLVAGPRVRHYVHPMRMATRWFWSRQMAVGSEWVVHRGRPRPGRFGVPWWAWSQFARRAGRAAVRWRPWPSRPFYDALIEAAQYYGYLRAPHDG